MPIGSIHVQTRPGQHDVERGRRGYPSAPIKQPVIVIATSGSRSAEDATAYAAELAANVDGQLRIVHVLPAIEYRVGRLAPMRPITRRARDPFTSPVLCRARELAWRHGSAATLQLLIGDVASTITAAATNAGAHLLVLSTPRQRQRFARSRLRRDWIENHAPCPITTTPASRVPADFR
jgi:nucleotide-binding universal stress UspA family protein